MLLSSEDGPKAFVKYLRVIVCNSLQKERMKNKSQNKQEIFVTNIQLSCHLHLWTGSGNNLASALRKQNRRK